MNASPLQRRNRRLVVPVVILCAVVVAFGVRLFDVQVFSASAIDTEANGRRGATATLWGERGGIIDRDGTVLATSIDRFDVTVSPVNVDVFDRADPDAGGSREVSPDEAFAEIAAIVGEDAAALRGAVDDALRADPGSNFAYLARSIPLEKYEQIRDLGIPWVYFERHPVRTYPNGQVAGNLTGFLGSDGTPLEGLEYALDACLAGSNGVEHYERSADGVAIPGSVVVEREAKQGGTVELTIDADVQWRTQQILAEQVNAMEAASGTAMIADTKTGEIVAAAEYPSVDPNDPAATEEAYRGAREFGSPFEPGSIMKPITASMVLDAGAADLDETVVVPSTWPGGDADFHDDAPHGTVDMNLPGVIVSSSNVGISTFGSRLDANTRHDYLERFGFGAPTEVGFPGESGGILHPADAWDPQTNYATTFGQGISVTTPQMVSAYQALANSGVAAPLTLVRGCTTEDGSVVDTPQGSSEQIVSPEAATETLSLIEATARHGILADEVAIPGYRVGIKTGTAQIADPETGAYYADSYTASMIGVAPIDDPRYVVLVSLVQPKTRSNSAAAAPAWHDVMASVLLANRVPPSPAPWPEITVVN